LNQALKLQAIRNRIARDLHDEIGSTLSSISLYSDVAKKMVKNKAPEAEGVLTQISEGTQDMMEAMGDIIWTINANSDRFDNVINRMHAFAVEVLEAKECKVHFNTTEHIRSIMMDMDQRKNLYLIFKEAINNTAKYSDCRNVWVHLSSDNDMLQLKVKDDGIGFDRTRVHHGNGLINMQNRAFELKGSLDIKSHPGEGTLIELECKV